MFGIDVLVSFSLVFLIFLFGFAVGCFFMFMIWRFSLGHVKFRQK